MNPFLSSGRAYTYKKGFALIVTLSVLALISVLTSVLIGYLDIARVDASRTKALLQANLYFSDLKDILSKQKNSKSLYGVLYDGPIPLRSEDGKFLFVLHCMPMANGVNINWLSYEENMKMEKQYSVAIKVFEHLMEVYNVRDPGRLEDMLLAAMGKNINVDTDVQSRLRQNDGIVSYQQFRQILDRYRFKEDDSEVMKIPWDKYFVFNPLGKDPAKNKIEGDYLSIELLSFLFDIDIERLREEWSPAPGALKRLLLDNLIAYDKGVFFDGVARQSSCEVDYTYKNERYRFVFVHSEGEVNGFEFYGKQ